VDVFELDVPPLVVVTGGLRVGSSVLPKNRHHAAIVTVSGCNGVWGLTPRSENRGSDPNAARVGVRPRFRFCPGRWRQVLKFLHQHRRKWLIPLTTISRTPLAGQRLQRKWPDDVEGIKPTPASTCTRVVTTSEMS